MTIKEVEEKTGLARSNVRFYEKEKLIEPFRNPGNGYRDYSGRDVEDIKKIAYLRTLGIPVGEIRNVISEKITLREAVEKQNEALKGQITELKEAKFLCEKMLCAEKISYEELQVEQYVTELQEYWEDNQSVFKLDSVSFLYIWGSFSIWAALTALCLLTAVLFYTKLPQKLPVQWSNGEVSSFVNKNFIFLYPVVCIGARYLLRPLIYAKLQRNNPFGKIMAEYLTNFLCFIALSAEVFSVLFVYGLVKNIETLLFVDIVVFLGILFAGISRVSCI